VPFSVYQLVANLAGFGGFLIDAYLKTRGDYLWYFGALILFEVALYMLILFKFDFKQKYKDH
jgi:hypothetical protein